jgi:hypothetical protein
VQENVRETGDGRVTDRPMLLYGQFVSRRTGTSQLDVTRFVNTAVAYCTCTVHDIQSRLAAHTLGGE